MRVELVDDYQFPKISSTGTSSAGSREATGDPNRETNSSAKDSHTVRRDLSQDSLDEQPNGNDYYIGINSTLNCSLNNGLGAPTSNSKFSAINDVIGEQHKDTADHLARPSRVVGPVDRHPIDKSHADSKLVDRSQINRNSSDQTNADRNVDKEKQQQVKQPNEYAYKIYQQSPHSKPADEHRNSVNSSNFMQHAKVANQSNHLADPPFEVPVLIETPCTPEPPADEECSNEPNSEPTAGSTTPRNTNSSFDNESENNLSKRKRTKRRMENQEEIDTLFNGGHWQFVV